MEYVIVFWLFTISTMNIDATTHWMVTEKGLIQPKLDSQFEMARPNDLLAFLNQDTHWDYILHLSDSISKKQGTINKYWSNLMRDTDITTLLTLSENCVKAGSLSALDWYISYFEDGTRRNIAEEEFMLYQPSQGEDTDVPDCKKLSSLIISLPAFDHLKGLKHMEKLTTKPELSLPGQISPIMTVDQFGHWVSSVLRKNTTSWLHFTMASWYWRLKGNAPKAMDCCRRGVYYAPNHYRDIALLSMGTVLHRSGMTEDAVKVVTSAAGLAPHYDINHFVLASMHAVLGDFNTSVRHYDRSLKLTPRFELARKYRHGVLCHAFLLRKMKVVNKTLVKLRQELIDVSVKESIWLKTQSAFLKSMKHTAVFDYRDVASSCEIMTRITGKNITGIKKEADKGSLIRYLLDGPMFHEEWLQARGVFALDSMYSLQKIMMHFDKHVRAASEHVLRTEPVPYTDAPLSKNTGPIRLVTRENEEVTKDFHSISDKDKSPSSQPEDDITFNLEVGPPLYPRSMHIDRNREDFDREALWPSEQLCEAATTSAEAVYSVFLPFENKGIKLRHLLTDKISMRADVEHELPWHPPYCPRDNDAAVNLHKKSHKHQLVSEVVTTDFLRQKLLEYVDNGDAELVKHMQDAEIGQRILVAMKRNIVPKWVIYTLTSLYWRVRREPVHALHCLVAASRTVRKRYRDLVLASLASVYLEMGYFDEAMAAAEEAYHLSMYEPATNFILAELNMIRKNGDTQMYHLKQVLRVEPTFMGELPRRLLVSWGCVLKRGRSLHDVENKEQVCTQMQPGIGMICEVENRNCHMATVECTSDGGTQRPSYDPSQPKGTPIGIMPTKAYQKVLNINDAIPSSAVIDDSFFNAFKQNMPPDSEDRAAHYDNYQRMMRSTNKALRGCGFRPCNDIRAEEFDVKLDDCKLQHLQLRYWVQYITLKQMQREPDLRLPADIPSLMPSSTRVPECRLASDLTRDFFMERMSRADTADWQPLVVAMQQFADIFNIFDFSTLGAKISSYIESNPRSWVGALGAGWWCGANGRGRCALRCLVSAYTLAPHAHAHHAVRALQALLFLQRKEQDAKEMAYLSFYRYPNKEEAMLVALAHTYLEEYDEAVWFYRYALSFDAQFLPARACLHAAICIMLFREKAVNDPSDLKTAT